MCSPWSIFKLNLYMSSIYKSDLKIFDKMGLWRKSLNPGPGCHIQMPSMVVSNHRELNIK